MVGDLLVCIAILSAHRTSVARQASILARRCGLLAKIKAGL
jgi:hypothetical protein